MNSTKLLATRKTAVAASANSAHGRRRLASLPKQTGKPAAQAMAAVGRITLALLLTATVAIFLFLAIGPRFLPYQTSTMLTGSMSPVINPGDVVVSARIQVSELRVGDVITYSIPIDDHKIETHRVTSIERDDAGTTSVITKGDANQSADPWVAVLSEDYIYKNVAVVPYLGSGIRALREPPVQAALLYGAPAVLVLFAMKAIWSKPKAQAETAEGSEDADREVQQ